jgi:hypothetical protein
MARELGAVISTDWMAKAVGLPKVQSEAQRNNFLIG